MVFHSVVWKYHFPLTNIMHFRNFLMTNVTKDVGQRKFSYKSWRNNMGLSGESENAILHFKPWVHRRLKRPYVHQEAFAREVKALIVVGKRSRNYLNGYSYKNKFIYFIRFIYKSLLHIPLWMHFNNGIYNQWEEGYMRIDKMWCHLY